MSEKDEKIEKRFGGIKKVRIFAARFENKRSSLTILRDHNEVKRIFTKLKNQHIEHVK